MEAILMVLDGDNDGIGCEGSWQFGWRGSGNGMEEVPLLQMNAKDRLIALEER